MKAADLTTDELISAKKTFEKLGKRLLSEERWYWHDLATGAVKLAEKQLEERRAASAPAAPARPTDRDADPLGWPLVM